jgi:hypothetical protein
MSHIVPGISAATTGAIVAAHQQQMMAEEERMATYTSEELEEDWEFKIVRANSPAFRKSEVLQKLLQEEAVAGWTMVEKFDDSRVRFKRPRNAREQDAYLPEGVDPDRTQYGAAAFLYGVLAIGVVLLIVFVLAFVVLVML